tara:strand:+ start:203 stop:784 length:582 start_codon:yes stop_codon:yes gene_type:complete
MKYTKIKELKKLPNNPRTIKNLDFEKLCASIQNNPDYFEARPLILSDRTGELIIIAGNQRYEAAQHLKLKEVPTYLLKDLTEEREKEIIIRDNISNGEWDWDKLANDWDSVDLKDWGLDVWQAPEDVDYSILDDEDETDSQLEDMAGGVKKAIQIEFEPDHYEDAAAIVKYWRERDAYIGKMILDFLTAERDK